jgi:hypothetical protein
VKRSKYHIGIEIDRLTNSIVNTISGDSFQTRILPVTKEDLKGVNRKIGWKFMGYIKEPKGVDLVVEPHVVTEEDKKIISEAIAHYKATGKFSGYQNLRELIASQRRKRKNNISLRSIVKIASISSAARI